MYVNKVLLTVALCATSVWCVDSGTLKRNARTVDLSSFLGWRSQALRNFRLARIEFWKWAKSGAASLIRLASSTTPMRIEFGPEDGPRAAGAYQRRFGYRGEWLIEQLGNGLGPGAWLHEPVPNTFLMPPPSLFKSYRANNFS